ncbi:MAG TPA: peroxidase-related enzyme [Chthoniobacterales bacterium]|nr:peroxidase-related enzyme [Chthoniobacterales bacterium]
MGPRKFVESTDPSGYKWLVSWIKIVSRQESAGRLRELYERVAGSDGTVDNVLQIHSLRPHTLEAHIALYKNVLHHSGNKLPKWLLETVGVYVSLLNGCAYCVAHHFAGLSGLLQDDNRAREIRDALEADVFDTAFDPRERAIFDYARQLTRSPGEIRETSIQTMRAAGLDDGEILEVNQVVSYFAYVNRTVLGLGVTTEGDTLGLSPNDSADPQNWRHT